MKANEWASGARCDLHDIPFCADCQKSSGLRRDASGEVAYRNDCVVASYVEITGEDYETAVEILRSVGYRPASGTPAKGLADALAAVGFRSERRGLGSVSARGTRYDGMSIPDARAASVGGRVFYLIGADRESAHAWTIIDGKVSRAFLRAPYKYGILEVIA